MAAGFREEPRQAEEQGRIYGQQSCMTPLRHARFAVDSPLEQRGFESWSHPHVVGSKAPALSVVRLRRRLGSGTGSSNLASSTGESSANLTSSIRAHLMTRPIAGPVRCLTPEPRRTDMRTAGALNRHPCSPALGARLTEQVQVHPAPSGSALASCARRQPRIP
jgi:hypothetical protein